MEDKTEIIRALRQWFQPGDVFELRILDAVTADYQRPHVESGYFDFEHIEAVPAAMAKLRCYRGAYVTVNPVNPALLARAVNRIRSVGREPTTADSDILCRRWLLIDCDAERPSGISSSDEEHAAALQKAQEIQTGLSSLDWPGPLILDSGNGAQLMYAVNLPANDDGLLQSCLTALSAVSDDKVKIDLTVHNPARIWRLPGTMNRKGDSTPERPHRMAKIVSAPQVMVAVSEEQLRGIVVAPKQGSAVALDDNGGVFDVDQWIIEHGVSVSPPQDWKGGRKWTFPVCPFNDSHNNKSAVLIQQQSGAMAFTCHHNGCIGNDWRKLRELKEPGCYDERDDSDVDLSLMIENIKAAKKAKLNPFSSPGSFPNRLLNPPGIISDIMELTLSTAPYPNRVLAFCGALAFVSHLIGRKACDKRNNFANLYIVALAASGTGKDHPRKVNFALAKRLNIIGNVADSFASGAGLEDTLFSTPSMLFQMDEVEWIFSTIKANRGDFMAESINEKLLKLYSASSTVYPLRKKARIICKETRNLKPDDFYAYIDHPSLSLFGTSVPRFFYESLSDRALENGLIARCMIIEADSRGRHGNPASIVPSDKLIEKLKIWSNKNLPMNMMGDPVEFITIPETDGASKRIEALHGLIDDMSAKYAEAGEYAAAAVYARIMERVFKLDMIYAVSANPLEPIITVDAVNWAFDIVEHVAKNLLHQAAAHVYQSESDREMKRVIQTIRKSGAISRRDLMRKLHYTARQMNEIWQSIGTNGSQEITMDNDGKWEINE